MRFHLTKLLVFCCWLLLLCQPALTRPDTKDIFNLKMRVDPPDTIRCGDIITVAIEFQNVTDKPFANFEVRAFFPNEIEKYCRLKEVVYATERNIPVVTDLGRNRFALWQIGDLQVGKRDSIIFRLNVQVAPNIPVFFTYTATAQAAGTSTSEVSFYHTFIPPCPGPSPDIGIRKERDRATASVGETVNFFLNVFNSSPDTAYNVMVEDSIPRGLAVDFVHLSHPFIDRRTMPNGVQVILWSFPGMFLPGASETIKIPTSVVLNPKIPTKLINQCDLTSDTPDVNDANDHAEVEVTIVPKYDLRLAYLGDHQRTLDPGTEEDYRLQISNLSTVRVENFYLDLRIDDGLADRDLYDIRVISDGGTSPDNVNVRWQIAALDSGQIITRLLRLRYNSDLVGNSAKCVNFFAKVDSVFRVENIDLFDLNPADNRTSWKRCLNDAFDLVLEPTPDNRKLAAPINQPQSYKLEFTNRSLLTLPAFTLRAMLQPTGPTLADNIKLTNPSHGGTSSGLKATWTIPSLAPNTTDSRTFEATIIGINMGGTFGFTLTGEAQVFPGENDTTNNRRIWETRATVATNLVVVDVSTSTPAPNIGGTAPIQIAYANRGSLDKDKAELRALITVTPSMPIYRIENITHNGQQVNANTVAWNIQPLPATGPESSGIRSFDLVFDNITQAADYLLKIVGEIERHDAADDPRDNRDSVNVRLMAMPQLYLSDIARSGALESDQTLTYSFSYGNQGNFPATNATLRLTLPQATSFDAWLDANGQPLPHDDLGNGQRQANLGDLSPGFQTTNTVRVKVMRREELLRNFTPGSSIDLKFEATLASTNVTQPVFKSRTDRLNVPGLVESFYLTRNTFRPEVHEGVEMYFDVVQDTEVRFKIYNVAGELIRTFTPIASVIGSRVRQNWDGRNDTGTLVASGLYFVFAEVGYKSARPYRKLIVVR